MANPAPKFDRSKFYILSGDLLQNLVDRIEELKIVIVPGSGLKVDEVGPDGTKISIDGTDVCP
jgi:hypothetical protein